MDLSPLVHDGEDLSRRLGFYWTPGKDLTVYRAIGHGHRDDVLGTKCPTPTPSAIVYGSSRRPRFKLAISGYTMKTQTALVLNNRDYTYGSHSLSHAYYFTDVGALLANT